MKRLFLLLVSISVLLSSCGGDSAEKLNETIVAGIDGTVGKMEKIADFIAADDYSSALAYVDSSAMFVSDYQVRIGSLNNKSGEEFKAASLAFLTHIEKTALPVYKQAIELYQTADANDDYDQANQQYEDAADLLNSMIDKIGDQQEGLKNVQAAFAKKNNMQLY